MRRLPTEYILKGIFLALVLYLAVAQGIAPPPHYYQTLAPINLSMLGGLLLIGIGLAGIIKLREGYRSHGRMMAFVLFLLLECPNLVYFGIIGGGLVGAWFVHRPETSHLLLPMLGGGIFIGVLFALLRQVQQRSVRLLLILMLAAGAVGAAMAWFLKMGGANVLADSTIFALQLLLGIPFFYLLTFAGQEEESEIEIGAICAFLALGGTIITYAFDSPQFRSMGLLIPVMLYFWYTWRVLPGLRVLKYVFRGMSYARVGRHRFALLAFRRALELDAANDMARDGFWQVHCDLDLETLADDHQTLELVDFDLCLERAGTILVQGRPPEKELNESMRLLELVVSQRPEMQPRVDYWHAVAQTYAGEYDGAATNLLHIIEPDHYGVDHPQRQEALVQAWQMGLILHPELRKRVGEPQLEIPGRRLEAIASVERHLQKEPQDATTWDLKRILYEDLHEAEFESYAEHNEGRAPGCDAEYLRELGMLKIEDPEHWQRGAEYLRMAVRTNSAIGPSLFVKIAQAHERADQPEEALANFRNARDAGLAHGVKNLSAETSRTYFATVKYLGEVALSKDDTDEAIENFLLYSESSGSGLETLRTLAELYHKKGDYLRALHHTERALIYDGKDADLIERRKTYYVSLDVDQLRGNEEKYRNLIDVDFCLDWAKTILDAPYSDDVEWLETASQLIDIASIMKPGSLFGKVMSSRVKLRFGQRDEALAQLEEVRDGKPESFATNDDEDAWYVANQLLGDLYMEVGKADDAIECYQDFRKSPRSGAKTLLKLGKAYEEVGDVKRAVNFYKQVTAYEGNPLTSEAYDALHRLGA